MQTLTAERKNWLRFPPVVSVVAMGLELELGTALWLHCNVWPNALGAVCYWEKKISPLKGERWEKEQNCTKVNAGAPFTKHTSLLLTSKGIIRSLE